MQAIEYGGLRRIRTSDRSVRSRVLYPAELRVRCLEARILVIRFRGVKLFIAKEMKTFLIFFNNFHELRVIEQGAQTLITLFGANKKSPA